MSLVFYYSPRSTASVTAWVLEELGIPHERVEIDLKARDQDKPGYRAINPNGKVPLVVHDGVSIFESAAITLHLGETFGVERDLFPAPGLERAEATRWIVWSNATLVPAAIRFHENKDKPAELEELFAILDAELKSKRFLVGGRFSLADVHLASIVGWVAMFGPALARHPSLEAWYQRCVDRPSHARSLAA